MPSRLATSRRPDAAWAEQQLPKRSAPSIGSRHGDTLSVTPIAS